MTPQRKISYKAQKNSVCPVCKFEHYREELLSGGGRLNSGKLTNELRRLWEPSRRYGKIYPLAYVITVCPKCLFAAFPKDFDALDDAENKNLKAQTDARRETVQKLFGALDLAQPRNLVLGAASYVLAVDCYHFRKTEVAPTPKKAILALRTAWLFGDIHEEIKERPFDKVADFYYMKAVDWYRSTLGIMQTGEEPIDAVGGLLGPDTDNNWGFDGVMYLNGYLTLKYREKLGGDAAGQIKLLMNSKKFLSKLYGGGKGSKNKPSVIIDMAKDVYDAINKTVEELGGDPNNYNV